MNRLKLLALSSAILTASQAAHAIEIGYDMVNSSSMNLISHNNSFANAFGSSGDGFQKYQRGVSASIPYSVLDDTISSYPADSLGIIDDNNLDEFFGVTDTKNSDNSTGDVNASWVFDVTGSTELSMSIDMAAMGDFEASDTFIWTASIDGGSEQILFTAVADESGSLTYTLGSGTPVDLNDPLTVNGVTLSNVLQTLSADITGTGLQLTVSLEANTDGGSEAFAFQNLRILSGEQGSDDPTDPPAPSIVKIHEIQGEGSSTPMANETVIVEAIVVGDFQNNDSDDNGQLGGFYLQEEDADADTSALSSEGIFVYDNTGTVDVQVGDKVQVTGKASEYSGQTQISASEIIVVSSDNTLPAITELSLPMAETTALEAYESMLVNFSQPLVISEYYNYDRYGEIVLAQPLDGEDRPFTPTALELPGSDAYLARLEANTLSRITLDDGSTSQNASSNRHPNGEEFTLDNRFRGGDWVSDITGIMDYRYSLYRIQPTQGATYESVNPRPALAPAVGSDFKVASFNVLNYFTTFDQDGNLCGPSLLECRGADNAEEFERQRAKILAALSDLDADIIGLIEIENNDAAVESLAADLNSFIGSETYAALSTGSIGGDAIKVGFIYNQNTTELEGDFAILDASVDSRFVDDKNRPVLAQTFKQTEDNALVTISINHFKSKGSDCNELSDPDLNDGQGNCNLTRLAAAQALADWLTTDPTDSGDADQLILGDLNSYAQEDPIAALSLAGFQDLVRTWQGDFTHSYVFSGQFGSLDYALSSSSLEPQVTGANVWNINADEPDILDYDTSYKSDVQDALYEANAFRSSDHDPVIVGLDLNGPPSCDDAYLFVKRKHENRRWLPVFIKGIKDPEGDSVKVVVEDAEMINRFGKAKNLARNFYINEKGRLFIRAHRDNGKPYRSQQLNVSVSAAAEGGYCDTELSSKVADLIPAKPHQKHHTKHSYYNNKHAWFGFGYPLTSRWDSRHWYNY